MQRLPQSRNGRLAVGCGGLLGLCFVVTLCSNLVSGGKPPATPVPTAAAQPLMAVDTEPAATAAVQDTATDEPQPTDLPPTDVPATEAPTAAPTKPPPPTAVSVPTEVPPPTAEPPTAGPPTEVPDPRPDLNANGDLDCKDFNTQAEAQAYWDYWRARGVPNPGRLDGNNNGVVCENF